MYFQYRGGLLQRLFESGPIFAVSGQGAVRDHAVLVDAAQAALNGKFERPTAHQDAVGVIKIFP